MAKVKGRGRLSKIKELPSEADEAVRWAALKLREEKITQIKILEEFNEKLAMLGLPPISKSAFNRHSIRMADILRRTNQTREIAAVLTDRMEPGQSDNVTITLAEMIKTLISELLDKGGEAGFTPQQAMQMATALKQAAAAEKMSSDRRSKLEEKIESAVDDTIEAVSKEMGFDDERAKWIRNKVVGVK